MSLERAPATLAVDSRCTHGEGVLWCDRRQSLLWIDIAERQLWQHTPASGSTFFIMSMTQA